MTAPARTRHAAHHGVRRAGWRSYRSVEPGAAREPPRPSPWIGTPWDAPVVTAAGFLGAAFGAALGHGGDPGVLLFTVLLFTAAGAGVGLAAILPE